MSDPLILALPSKGRLMEQCAAMLAKAGLVISKSGSARGYKGDIAGLPGVEVNFVSSSEIAQLLKNGKAHLGITGEDLLRETIADCDARVTFLRPCGFGQADVVVAVPAAWIDVRHMADLEEMASSFRRVHGRRVRVATKYMNLTRRFFSHNGVTGYRIVESLGATEGAPAALLGRADRRHHHHGGHAARQRPQGAGRRRDLAIAGQPGVLQRRPLVARAAPPGGRGGGEAGGVT